MGGRVGAGGRARVRVRVGAGARVRVGARVGARVRVGAGLQLLREATVFSYPYP